MSASISFPAFVVGLVITALSPGSSVIGTRRIELDMLGRLSLSKLDLIISPLVRRGEVKSTDDLEDVRRGGGGFGGTAVPEDDALGVIVRSGAAIDV